jgi:hypothetical protein
MTGGTDQISVFASKRKISVACVVEFGVFPGRFAMARLALFAVAALVAIVIAVTTVTVLFRFGFGESFCVAGFAANFFVSAT